MLSLGCVRSPHVCVTPHELQPETVAEDRDEEVTDEETAPGGGPRLGGKEIRPDDMVELKEDVERTHETIPGKLLVDLPRYNGPHWPLPETDPSEDWARLLRRIR